MKQINEKFEDAEYKIIKDAKDKSKLTWRQFLIKAASQYKGDSSE